MERRDPHRPETGDEATRRLQREYNDRRQQPGETNADGVLRRRRESIIAAWPPGSPRRQEP